MRYLLGAAIGLVLLIAVGVVATIALDSPAVPPPLERVMAPFRSVDFSSLPPVSLYAARDGAQLAYRRYPGTPERMVVLIHGSAGSSIAMHVTAKALQAAGATVIVPDLRGHGQSGPPGDIAYTGQLDDDLEDLLGNLDHTDHPTDTTLIGFSSGGGFALRIAGGRLGQRFGRFILLAPYLRYDAPNARTESAGGWTSVAIPRIVALSFIDRLGITAFGGLPVLAFALPPGNPAHLTPTYSYRLLENFKPDDDYLGDLRRAPRPLMAIAGTDDELFLSAKLHDALAAGRPGTRVDLVPGVGHIGLTTTAAGTAAIVKAWSGPF